MSEVGEINHKEHGSLQRKAERSSHKLRNKSQAFWNEAGDSSYRVTNNESTYILNGLGHTGENAESLHIENVPKDVRKESVYYKKDSSNPKGAMTVKEIPSSEASIKEKGREDSMIGRNVFSIGHSNEKFGRYVPEALDYNPALMMMMLPQRTKKLTDDEYGKWFEQQINQSIQQQKNPKIALEAMFSKEYEENNKAEIVMAYLQEDKLYVANRGNFQAVLGREGFAEPLTEYVSSAEEVKVTEHVLPQGESQLILGSAGLWKSGLTSEEAAKIIYQLYQENPDEKDPEKASKLLRDEAIKRLTERGEEIPDISVLIVNLDIPERSAQDSVVGKRVHKTILPYGRGFPKAA